jgi:hypothetical protein
MRLMTMTFASACRPSNIAWKQLSEKKHEADISGRVDQFQYPNGSHSESFWKVRLPSIKRQLCFSRIFTRYSESLTVNSPVPQSNYQSKWIINEIMMDCPLRKLNIQFYPTNNVNPLQHTQILSSRNQPTNAADVDIFGALSPPERIISSKTSAVRTLH